MRITNVDIAAGLTIKVGGVVVLRVFKVGERRAKIGVAAPADMTITMESTGNADPVDPHGPYVVGKE